MKRLFLTDTDTIAKGGVSETLEGIATEIEEVVRMLVLASHRAEVMMDTCALMGIGNWLVGQYRDDWATIHADLIGALELFQEEK